MLAPQRPLLAAFLSLATLAAQPAPDPLKGLQFRSIGPHRGGRVTAVAGVHTQPNTYYFGATGGGLWKTTDGGASWAPVTDGQLGTGSVGAVAVADSDPNVVYLGMGEVPIRGNVSHGDGVYRSLDAGKSWKRVGLEDSRHIGRIRVHPRNPDVAYAAVLGHIFGPHPTRGVYRTQDGGKTWTRVLERGKAGAIDLVMDPANPNVLYAALWDVRRTPHSLESGGPDSGLFKTMDGGDTWKEITRASGLPKGTVGKVGVAVSPANPERVWALIEADDGGVFRSDNGGQTWTRTNDDRTLRQRAWYYTRIYADPLLADTVYVLNVAFHRSNDGGRTFGRIPTPHGDNHDLWIARDSSQRMIEGNDGGANVTTDGGRSWTDQAHPTAQFYRVALDGDFPYNVYGAQQDNTTVRIRSRTSGGGIDVRDWHAVGGGESGWIAPSPRDSNIVFAGSYGGLLTRYDHRTGQTRNVTVWPDNPMGYGAEGMRFRFQWNFPILFSPHDPSVLYTAGNRLFRSTNEGQSWEAISPDLTRNDPSRLGPSGGPITKDNTGVEYYCTIFTVAESPRQKGVLWAGSDDGLVHVSRDGGKAWSNVTPKELPEWIQVNSIEASPHDPAVAYVAATMYKSDDFRPYLYRTADYGKTWTKIVTGLPEGAFTRVIREDPARRGLLYAGTETGLHVSFDDGASWKPLQLNLPVVPVTDLAIHARDKDLVVATQGRSFWVLDALPVLHQWQADVAGRPAHLFAPEETVRMGGGPQLPVRRAVGQNPPGGVVVHYWLKEKPQGEATLEFLDGQGAVIRTFTSAQPAEAAEEAGGGDEDEGPRPAPPARVAAEPGLNRFVWDMRHADATKFPGMILWGGSVRGPLAVPGSYSVRLTVNGQTLTQPFAVRKDPRLETTPEEFQKQLALLLQIRDKLSATHDAIVRIRQLRSQAQGWAERAKSLADPKAAAAIQEGAKSLSAKLMAVEEELYQTKLRSSQDPLNYPIRLNNKLAVLGSVVAGTDAAPTAQSYQLHEELAGRINAQLDALRRVQEGDLPAFNRLIREQNVPAVGAP